jgi:hypothetical protein
LSQDSTAQAALPRLLRQLEASTTGDSVRTIITLRDLAAFGSAAHAASPAVAALLASPEPDVRVAAARALGFLGYDQPERLTALLDDPDTRLGWVVAETLGRLRNPVALDSLAEVAESHWYPPTRQAAADAIRHIRDGSDYPNASPNRFALLFFSYEEVGFDLRSCGERYDANRHAGSEVAVDDGRLVWWNRGEFGGELEHVDLEGSRTSVLKDNVVDVHAFDGSYLIVAGLAHMGLSRGGLYRLERQGSKWSARAWRRLPGAPYSSLVTAEGELLVHTYGGSIIVSPSGRMRMADCAATPAQ